MKRIWLVGLIVLVAIILASIPLTAAGPGEPPGLEKALAAQTKHQEALFKVAGVEGVGVGLNDNDQPSVIVFTDKPGVRGIPASLDGVPVRAVASGKFEALARPSKPTNTAPTVTISSPSNGQNYNTGVTITFTGSATDSQDGNLTSSLTWTCAGAPIWTGGSFTKTFADGIYNVTASVTDKGGATGSATVIFGVGTVGLTTADRWPRPVPIGVSTGHPDITAGTIGARVKDASGNLYALSNNHVYANENNASIGDNVLQPGTYDNGMDPEDAIGTLAAKKDIEFSMLASNKIDAAIASVSTNTLGNSTPANGYGIPRSSPATAVVKMSVQKYGRTTGLTSGRVYATNASVNVGYDTGTARFVNQIIITPGTFSAGGDSGSLIVVKKAGTADDLKPVGLLFAGSNLYTIANPIQPVLDYFTSVVGSTVTIDGN